MGNNGEENGNNPFLVSALGVGVLGFIKLQGHFLEFMGQLMRLGSDDSALGRI